MSEIDLSNPAAFRAEAERRQKLRAAGVQSFGAAPPAPQPPVAATASVALVSEKPVGISNNVRPAIAPPDDPFAGMNATERRRAVELEALKRAGEIQRWAYEAITLKLAPGLRYTPDFYVIEASGLIRIEETKGKWEDDARAKIKMAAHLFPEFTFIALRARKKKDGGGWARESF